MDRRTTLRALGISAFLVTAAVVALVVFATHNTPCGPAPVPPANAELMKAIVLRCYGTPELRGVLQPDGAVVIVGNAEKRDWLGSSIDTLERDIVGAFVSQRFMRMRSDPKKEDMLALRELIQAGKLVPVIDRRYSLINVD